MSDPLPTPTDSNDLPGSLGSVWRHELEGLRNDWWWFLLLGIALVVLGTFALGAAVFVTFATVVFFGILLVAGGIAQLISSFWAGRWSGFLVHLLVSLLYIITGFIMIDQPVESAMAITLLLAVMFFVSGIFRIVAALMFRFPHWGWPLLNGVISILLGIMIYKQWPASGVWVIGLFMGIEMIFNGWSWIMIAFGLRALPKTK
jgi:uncharacterized membrane protein HdeD (DUF308 family)